MDGIAQRTISSRHRQIADEVWATLPGRATPYRTGSAFGYVRDQSVRRAVADSSAVAADLEVSLRAIIEDDLSVPAPGLIGPSAPRVTPSAPASPSGNEEHPPSSGAAQRPRPMSVTDQLLAAPASTAAWEKAEQACLALHRGWDDEAERLFTDATTLVPTDPFLWFGAGLASATSDPGRAARAMTNASRYLAPTDPQGGAYCAIAACVLWERQGNTPRARRTLEEHAELVDLPCPAIALHLARLDGERTQRIEEALSADPLVEADLMALGFFEHDDARARWEERRRRTAEEIRLLEDSVDELRLVDGGPGWGADRDRADGSDDEGALPLTRLEARLWRRVRTVDAALDAARHTVTERERARRAKEDELASELAVARRDLDTFGTLRFFLVGLVVALALLAAMVWGRIFADANPDSAWMIRVAVVAIQVALLAWALAEFLRAWWPRRHFARARQAQLRVPQLEWEAAQLRRGEFDVRRRFNRAAREAELRKGRISDRRKTIVPARPRFGARPLDDTL